MSETATHHAVFVESPAPVAFGDVFAPPLDSNQAEFTGSNAISAAGDLSLGGADAFTIRVRADVAGSVDANLLDVPGLISITTLGTDPDNYYKLRFTGLCEDASVTMLDGSAPFAGSTENVVTYDGAYVKPSGARAFIYFIASAAEETRATRFVLHINRPYVSPSASPRQNPPRASHGPHCVIHME